MFRVSSGGDPSLRRDVAYFARFALVTLKQGLGLSRRGDRTFYIDRFARLLQSGALERDYKILARTNDDGVGAQAQAAMSAICFAEAFGLQYVHRPFRVVMHAECEMSEWVRRCEEHFNLGAGALQLADCKSPIVALEDLLMTPDQWPSGSIVAATHYLHYCNQDPQAWERCLPLIRGRYRQNKPPRKPGPFTVAMHMRRGDVTADKLTANNFTPTAVFVKTIEEIRRALKQRAPDARLLLFSQGDPSNFEELTRLGCELHLNGSALDTHRQMIDADVLIMSKGAFSYTAGVLNEGIVLYDPQKYRALQDWMVRRADGGFDEAQFGRRIEALLANTKR